MNLMNANQSKATTLSINPKKQILYDENDYFNGGPAVPGTGAGVGTGSASGNNPNPTSIVLGSLIGGSNTEATTTTINPNTTGTGGQVTTPSDGDGLNGDPKSTAPDGSRIKFDLNSGLARGGEQATKPDTIEFKIPGKDDSETSSIADRTTLSATDHIVKKFRQKFIILHYSPFKAVWDWIILLLVVYTAVFTPFTVAFLINEDEKRAKLNQHASTRSFKKLHTGADPFVVIDLIVDLMFLLDVFISFRTTFVSKEGEAIYDPMLIAKNYLKGWFIIDAFSAMPYDLLLFGSGNIDTIKITGLLKTFRLIRLIRIFPKLQKFSEYGLAMLLLLLAVFALVGHWLACVFYAIAYIERPTLPEPKYSWLDHLAEKYNMPYHENNSDSGPDLKSKYITALFFTLTSLTSVGFGNVSPNTNWEKIFSICSMMLGSLISAAIFGNVTTIIMKMYQGTEELKEMQESVKDFIKFHYIPKQLAKRMQESFEHTWSYTNGIDMNMVLKSFPESLQADICLHLNRQLLKNCAAFQDASDGCMRMLALQFNSTHVPPDDTLIHKGDILTAIYFIARGRIEISRDGEVMAILDKNDIFGENIGKYQKRDVMGRSSCDVRALSYCDLHKIERCDLLDVMEIYPDFADLFEEKFQVSFDLSECQLIEQKPSKKKSSRHLKYSKSSKNGSNKSLNKHNGSGNGPASRSTSSAAHHAAHVAEHATSKPAHLASKAANTATATNLDGKPVFQIVNVDPIEENFLQSSHSSNLSVMKKYSLGENLLNSSYSPLDSSVNLSTSQSFLLQKQKSITSFDSNSNLMQVNSTRRVSGILRRKPRLVRNASRLSPMISNIVGRRNSSVPNALPAPKRQVSTISEVEAEIETLVARVIKVEETLHNQMNMLTNFVFNYVVNDNSKGVNLMSNENNSHQ